MRLADAKGLLSEEHFSVDGTLIQAWASHKSFRPKDGSNDPDARLFRKSFNTASILCCQDHVLMENRSGLVVGAVVAHADGRGERVAAPAMLDTVPGTRPKSLGADKAYDTQDFVAACRERNVTPHVAGNDTRRGGSAIDGRTTRHDGYELSQRARKRIEEPFGWAKTVGRIRQTVYRGLRRVAQHFKLTMTASNILRIARMPGAVL
jgi:hypothetical protein